MLSEHFTVTAMGSFAMSWKLAPLMVKVSLTSLLKTVGVTESMRGGAAPPTVKAFWSTPTPPSGLMATRS